VRKIDRKLSLGLSRNGHLVSEMFFFFTFATGMKKSQLNGKKTHVVEHSKELREVTNFFLMLLVITRTILTICELLPFFNRLVIN